MGQYYTYAWLRVDGTPYYIGKGSGGRAWRKDKFSPPPGRVLILKRNLCELDAFKHEVYMIAVYGRKDLGTGILYNFTDGGEGTSGRPCSEETRLKISLTNSNPSEVTRVKMSKASTGRTHTRETRQKIGETVSAKFTGEGNPFFGKTHTETTRQKISEATSGDSTATHSCAATARENRPRPRAGTVHRRPQRTRHSGATCRHGWAHPWRAGLLPWRR